MKVDDLTEEERASMPAIRERPIEIKIFTDRVDALRNGAEAVPGVRVSEAAPNPVANEPPVAVDQPPAEAAAEPDQIADQGEAGQAPAAEGGDEGGGGAQRDLRTEARSLTHLLTHLPKNPYCDACIRAKMRNRKRFAGAFKVKRDPKKWCDIVSADHLVSKGSRMRGVTGHTNALVIKDMFSELQQMLESLKTTFDAST